MNSAYRSYSNRKAGYPSVPSCDEDLLDGRASYYKIPVSSYFAVKFRLCPADKYLDLEFSTRGLNVASKSTIREF